MTDDLFLIQCAGSGGTSPFGCNGATLVTSPVLTPVTVGADGTLVTSMHVPRAIVIGGSPTTPTQEFNCASGCSISLFRVAGPSAGDWTFIAGTPIAVAGSVSQSRVVNGAGTNVSGSTNLNLDCVPGTPLLVYLTTHDAEGSDLHSAPGTAMASVCVAPVVSFATCDEPADPQLGPFPDPDVVQSSANIQLADAAAVRQSTLTMLADPANTAFRAAFVTALRAALDEDPVFRAEFVAALQGH